MNFQKITSESSEAYHQQAFFAYCVVAHLHGFDVADKFTWMGVAALPKFADKINNAAWPMFKPALPALEWIHAIPNGGARGDDPRTRAIRGGQLKAEGVKTGIPDIFLPYPILKGGDDYCGLYIEMKRENLKPKSAAAKGGLSDEQIAFAKYAIANDYEFEVCYGWKEAVQAIKNYLM